MFGLIAAGVGLAASAFGAHKANKANIRSASDQMDFQERMSDTAYQRGMVDMRKAGLNPMLAYSQGGASAPSGAMAAPSQDVAGKGVTSAMNAAQHAQTFQANKFNALKSENDYKQEVISGTARAKADALRKNPELLATPDNISTAKSYLKGPATRASQSLFPKKRAYKTNLAPGQAQKYIKHLRETGKLKRSKPESNPEYKRALMRSYK